MKQVIQNLGSGKTSIENIPVPAVRAGHLLVRSSTSLVSTGTERMLLDFGKANLLQKARQQPDKVRMVLDKMKTDGVGPTIRSAKAKLDQPLPSGYCNVGTVIEVGESVSGFQVGDRVVSNGQHAEFVCVPAILCAKVPDSVGDDVASLTVLGAISLQGIRLLKPEIGENIVVTGLGLIGLFTVQLLRANGCNVLGIDPDPKRCEMAESFGAASCCLTSGQDVMGLANQFSGGRGVDGVIITASTKSNEPVRQAANMCRKRGRIVLVGVAGLELSRADFYEKELTFQVSCSYGPGRYDPAYEAKGQDYPFGFVRWTEQRNFEAVLGLIAAGDLELSRLISHRFPVSEAEAAYKVVSDGSPLGILFEYPPASEVPVDREVQLNGTAKAESAVAAKIALIGAGNYAAQMLIPAIAATNARLQTLVSAGGVSGVHLGKKHGFDSASTDSAATLADPKINTVFIATRHDNHASLACEAIRNGKHVFVEKPLAVSRSQLKSIVDSYQEVISEAVAPIIMVGFNRRFAPQVVKLKSLIEATNEPKSFVMTVNAGEIPADHWVHDPKEGGGRIIGEACHFIDLLRFLADSPISKVHAVKMGNAAGVAITEDKATITLEFTDGSFGTVHYLANGHRSFPKERLTVFCGGAIIDLDNFRQMKGYGWPGFSKMNMRSQDKGHGDCVQAFVNAVEVGEASPIPFDEIIEVTNATFDAVDQMRSS